MLLSEESTTAIPAGGEANAFGLGEGVDVDGWIVLEGSMLSCIAQVVTGLGEVLGM